MTGSCVQCGTSLAASPSEWWCSESCQIAWQSATKTPSTPRAIPHPLGGITYPIDPHDPAGDRLFYGRTTA